MLARSEDQGEEPWGSALPKGRRPENKLPPGNFKANGTPDFDIRAFERPQTVGECFFEGTLIDVALVSGRSQ